jgi:hypothetical protein
VIYRLHPVTGLGASLAMSSTWREAERLVP